MERAMVEIDLPPWATIALGALVAISVAYLVGPLMVASLAERRLARAKPPISRVRLWAITSGLLLLALAIMAAAILFPTATRIIGATALSVGLTFWVASFFIPDN